MSSLPKEVLMTLENTYGPVVINFALTQMPQGHAPAHIKEQWLGVPLPVRQDNLGGLATRYYDLLSGSYKDNDDPISVAGIEAVHALQEADHLAAAEFWTPYQLGLFTFRAYEGEFQALDQGQ